MESCADFYNEISQLKYIGSILGSTVQTTPNSHVEIGGDRIEYDWADSKAAYRRKPLKMKKMKEMFRQLVQEVTSRDFLNIRTVRSSSKKARAYVCAYFAAEFETENEMEVDKHDLKLL